MGGPVTGCACTTSNRFSQELHIIKLQFVHKLFTNLNAKNPGLTKQKYSQIMLSSYAVNRVFKWRQNEHCKHTSTPYSRVNDLCFGCKSYLYSLWPGHINKCSLGIIDRVNYSCQFYFSANAILVFFGRDNVILCNGCMSFNRKCSNLTCLLMTVLNMDRISD